MNDRRIDDGTGERKRLSSKILQRDKAGRWPAQGVLTRHWFLPPLEEGVMPFGRTVPLAVQDTGGRR